MARFVGGAARGATKAVVRAVLEAVESVRMDAHASRLVVAVPSSEVPVTMAEDSVVTDEELLEDRPVVLSPDPTPASLVLSLVGRFRLRFGRGERVVVSTVAVDSVAGIRVANGFRSSNWS